jgi:capsular exopolysaccharide synthesis family protein
MVATNLAVTLAELGESVLLIDADMRRPKLQDTFGISSKTGLSAYLTGNSDWRNVVRPTSIAGLNVILCGDVHPNPVRLLSSDRMAKLIEEAGEEYKHVIIDSTPVLNVADSRILSRLVEAVILVIKSGATPQVLVQRAEAHVRIAGAKIIGVVLNRFNDEPYAHFSSPLYYSART